MANQQVLDATLKSILTIFRDTEELELKVARNMRSNAQRSNITRAIEDQVGAFASTRARERARMLLSLWLYACAHYRAAVLGACCVLRAAT